MTQGKIVRTKLKELFQHQIMEIQTAAKGIIILLGSSEMTMTM